MELCAQELLHPVLVLHHLLDDAGLCAHAGTGEGLEDGGILLGWLPGCCTHHRIDLQEVGRVWLLTGMV